MTHTEAAAALDEAEFDRRQDAWHEESADCRGRGAAELAEWQRIVLLLATTGAPYDPDSDAVAQDEENAGIEKPRRPELADEHHRTALTPDVLRHALLRTLARTQLLDGLSEDEQAAIERLPHTDPSAALAVNALLARAHDAGAGGAHERDRS
ncbi:hypothetical protein [Streptomyces jumonjinensis]|uniref:hypothetical protein n=1 Tax=Streptomyces jumonjinensis TaxID=1945 RepID=UPI0037A58097